MIPKSFTFDIKNHVSLSSGFGNSVIEYRFQTFANLFADIDPLLFLKLQNIRHLDSRVWMSKARFYKLPFKYSYSQKLLFGFSRIKFLSVDQAEFDILIRRFKRAIENRKEMVEILNVELKKIK